MTILRASFISLITPTMHKTSNFRQILLCFYKLALPVLLDANFVNFIFAAQLFSTSPSVFRPMQLTRSKKKLDAAVSMAIPL